MISNMSVGKDTAPAVKDYMFALYGVKWKNKNEQLSAWDFEKSSVILKVQCVFSLFYSGVRAYKINDCSEGLSLDAPT